MTFTIKLRAETTCSVDVWCCLSHVSYFEDITLFVFSVFMY